VVARVRGGEELVERDDLEPIVAEDANPLAVTGMKLDTTTGPLLAIRPSLRP